MEAFFYFKNLVRRDTGEGLKYSELNPGVSSSFLGPSRGIRWQVMDGGDFRVN